jgi:hypothetical protein
MRLTYPRVQSRLVRADQYDAHQPADLAVEGPKVIAPKGLCMNNLVDQGLSG